MSHHLLLFKDIVNIFEKRFSNDSNCQYVLKKHFSHIHLNYPFSNLGAEIDEDVYCHQYLITMKISQQDYRKGCIYFPKSIH